MATPDYPKSTCCILGCARWSRKFSGEWMCGKHWRMADRRSKRVLRRIWRLQANPESMAPGRRGHLRRLEWRIWDREKQRVTQISAGIL